MALERARAILLHRPRQVGNGCARPEMARKRRGTLAGTHLNRANSRSADRAACPILEMAAEGSPTATPSLRPRTDRAPVECLEPTVTSAFMGRWMRGRRGRPG